MRFFCSDHHWGHNQIIDYCGRPFTRWNMTEELIRLWNETVGPDDEVLHLGDFGKMPSGKIKEIVGRLNGTIDIYCGNHDKFKNLESTNVFRNVYPEGSEVFIQIGEYKVLVNHLPYRGGLIMPHDKKFIDRCPKDKGHALLCGHIHQHWLTHGRMINVGVDRWGFKPVPETKILEMLNPIVPLNNRVNPSAPLKSPLMDFLADVKISPVVEDWMRAGKRATYYTLPTKENPLKWAAVDFASRWKKETGDANGFTK